MFNNLFDEEIVNSKININQYSEEDINILRLIRSENVGPRMFTELMCLFKTAKEALYNIKDFAAKGGRKKPIIVCSQENACKELEQIKNFGAGYITFKSEFYPYLLKKIHSAPPFLTYKGNVDLLKKTKTIAIIGSRNCSVSAKNFTHKITTDLINEDYTIVSGLALGIDAVAHNAAINNTIAVIAGGIDTRYPANNKLLYEKITDQSVIITEYPFGTPVSTHSFPQRNRIVSAISQGILVIEARVNSGSLITAKYGIEQNKEVFAVPGFPLDTRSKGSNKLIKEGAYLVEDIQDIINNIGHIDSDLNHRQNNFDDIYNNSHQVNSKKNAEFDMEQTHVTNSMRTKVIDALSSMPISYDQIVMETGLSLKIIYIICIELELADKLKRTHDGKLYLTYI